MMRRNVMQEDKIMDIYDFIPSPDVADYCRKIGHRFSPIDMAVLIDMSDKTIRERHDAWRAIMSEYPDMPIRKKLLSRELSSSLHECLREKIALEEKMLMDFLTPGDGVVYLGEINEAERDPYPLSVRQPSKPFLTGCFSSFEKALEQTKKEWEWEGAGMEYASILREVVDHENKWRSVRVNRRGEVVSVNLNPLSNQSTLILNMTFVNIPIPFEKGDIVTIDDEIPCVLYDMVHWHNNYQDYVLDNYGVMDNGGGCYMLTEDGKLTHVYGKPFLTHRLRYYKGELKGREQFLEYVSHYIKKEESVDWLISAWYRFYIQAQFEEANSHSSSFPSLEHLQGKI